ncbi:MAG: sulfotransferase domain-containing protein [Nitrospirota bacterium]|nr:sulfotransferase domain-containing protein [Nitrospirota bacterium]
MFKRILKGIIENKPLIKIIEKIARTSSSANVFIACFPKSGSTYLTTLLSEITGFQSRMAVQFCGHNEQDIFETPLRYLSLRNSITQQHVKGTNNNVKLLKKYNIKPVILVRNIFDVVLSLHNHIEREDHRILLGYVHKEYFGMSKEEKLLYVIRVMLPWYFNFYMSWREASKEMDVLWTSYEELFSNQIDTVSRILSFYDIHVNHNQIQSAILEMKSKNTRLNVGIKGRGANLPERHKEEILNLASVWKVDKKEMQIIGLTQSVQSVVK